MMPTPPPAIVFPVFAQVDVPRVAGCLREVERRHGSHRRGAHREQGPYQFTPEAWAEETELPFALADDPVVSGHVARGRLHRIRYELIKAHLEPTAYNMALAWNGGINAVILHKWQPQEAKDYAIRVDHLYRDTTFIP